MAPLSVGCILKEPQDEKTAQTQELLVILLVKKKKRQEDSALQISCAILLVSDWTCDVPKSGKAEAKSSLWGGDEPVCIEG
jgi:hypothetical protein